MFSLTDQTSLSWLLRNDELTNSAAWACINVISDDIAKLPLRLLRRSDDGSLIPVRQDDAELGRLAKVLRSPSKHHTQSSWLKWTVQTMLRKPHTVHAIVRDFNNDVVELAPIVQGASVHEDYPTGDLVYRFTFRGLSYTLGYEDVLDFKPFCYNGVSGISPTEAANKAIRLASQLERHTENIFKSGARPGGFLKSANQGSEAVNQRLKERQEVNVGGEANSGRLMVLPPGVEFQPVSMTSVDAQHAQQRQMQIEEVARFYRVPLHRIGILKDNSYATASQAQQDYVNNTLMPYLELIEQELELKLLGNSDDLEISFDVDRILRADESTRFRTYQTAVQTGLMNRNECRAREGLPQIPGLDEFLSPLNLGGVNPATPAPGENTRDE